MLRLSMASRFLSWGIFRSLRYLKSSSILISSPQPVGWINDTPTEKEQKVITLYYYEELTLKEISSILEVSESRVSQLHTRALKKMKVKMGNYMGILTDN